MDELKKSIMYLEHGNELVVSKLRVLIDSLIKYQEGTLPSNDMLFDSFYKHLIGYNGQLNFDNYIIVFERIHYTKCMTLREHSTGIPVEFACRSIAKETIDSREVLIQFLSIFMDTTGIIAIPAWKILEIFDDSENIDKSQVERNLWRAYRRSISPICYIQSHNRLLPIYCKEHADRIVNLYNQQEKTNCHNNLDLLLNPTTDKTEKLAYNLERKK